MWWSEWWPREQGKKEKDIEKDKEVHPSRPGLGCEEIFTPPEQLPISGLYVTKAVVMLPYKQAS